MNPELQNYSTDLALVRGHKKRFTWGRIECFYDVGPYVFAQYQSDLRPEDMPLYFVWVDGVSTNSSFETLESAMLYGVGYKNIGNTNTLSYMVKAAGKILLTEDSD